MNTIFINSENSRIPDPHRLLLNLTDNIDLRRKENIYVYIYIYNLGKKKTLRTDSKE